MIFISKNRKSYSANAFLSGIVKLELQQSQLHRYLFCHFPPLIYLLEHVLPQFGLNQQRHTEVAALRTQDPYLLPFLIELQIADKQFFLVHSFLLSVFEVEELTVKNGEEDRAFSITLPALNNGLACELGIPFPFLCIKGRAFGIVSSEKGP